MKKYIKEYLTAPVAYTLILINIIILGIEYYLSGSFFITGETFKKLGAVSTHDYSIHIFTYMFLHAGLLHIFFNMRALSSWGVSAEKDWGSFKFIMIYLISGVVAGFAIAEFGHVYAVGAVGASGAIMGIDGAELAFLIKFKLYKTESEKKYLKTFLLDLLVMLAIGFLPYISGVGHAGGFVAGFVMSWIIFSTNKPYSLTEKETI